VPRCGGGGRRSSIAPSDRPRPPGPRNRSKTLLLTPAAVTTHEDHLRPGPSARPRLTTHQPPRHLQHPGGHACPRP
jgi:hypothetical protein